MRVLGIDPGATHVGVSEWDDDVCSTAYELTPHGLATAVHAGLLVGRDVVAVEDYRPQGGFGDSRTGIDTVELNGFVCWSVALMFPSGPRLVRVSRSQRAAALSRMHAVGYRFRGEGRGDHARDAEAVVVAAMKWSAKDLA